MRTFPDPTGEFVKGAVSAEDFKPIASYDPDGDCIEFIASNENFYAKRLDSLVTVYYSMDKHEVVGSVIKGVKRLVREIFKRAPGFVIEIEGDKIKLEHIFRVCAYSQDLEPNGFEFKVYRSLKNAAKKSSIELDARILKPAA